MAKTRQHYKRYDIYDKMVEEWGLFDSYIDFFMFAASVGYATVDRATAASYGDADFTGEDDQRAEMLWMHFADKSTYRAVAASIAYQHTGEPEALVDPDVQLEVLARYAKAGAERLTKEFGDAASPPRDGVLTFIRNEHPESEPSTSDTLNQIVQSFDKDIMG